MTYTQEHLTRLLTTGKYDELTRICAEVCYGWGLKPLLTGTYFHGLNDGKEFLIDTRAFDPLANTEKGRSQAFELAEKFDCFPFKLDFGEWCILIKPRYAALDVYSDKSQHAIVIAAILTAQQENNDE